MHLTKEEERILEGYYGEWPSKALKLLVSIGELNGAKRLIGIKRVHLSGVSYKTVGDPILNLLEEMASSNVKVKTYTTLNPSGLDLTKWQDLGFPRDFAEKQMRIINAFKKMGVKTTLTCTPYFFDNRPKFGEKIAFAESSAVVYTNSLIGARTNRHGNLDALAAAIIGKVPEYGLLLKENRKANLLVKVKDKIKLIEDFGLLGLYIGDKLGSKEIPAFMLKNDRVNEFDLRSMGAALAASGGIALFHAIGITPEAKNLKEAFQNDQPSDKIDVTLEDIRDFKYNMVEEKGIPELVAIGCPHASIEEIELIAEKVKGRRLKKDVKFWIFTSRATMNLVKKKGIDQVLQGVGIKLIADTCMVVAPLEDMGFNFVLTNSGKATFYIPKLSKNRLVADMKNIDEIISLIFE